MPECDASFKKESLKHKSLKMCAFVVFFWCIFLFLVPPFVLSHCTIMSVCDFVEVILFCNTTQQPT